MTVGEVLGRLFVLGLLILAALGLGEWVSSESSQQATANPATYTTEAFITPAIPASNGPIVEATTTPTPAPAATVASTTAAQIAAATKNNSTALVPSGCKLVDMGGGWRYLDLGTTGGDACITQGFGADNKSPFPFNSLPVQNDVTAKYQQAGVHNVIVIPDVTPNKPATVIVAVEKGRLGDSWKLSINGQQVAISNTAWSLPGIYRIDVPASLITSVTMVLDFDNTMPVGGPENSNSYGALIYQDPS